MITPEEVFWSYRLGHVSQQQHSHLCCSLVGCGCGSCGCDGDGGGGDGGGGGGGLVLHTRALNL